VTDGQRFPGLGPFPL